MDHIVYQIKYDNKAKRKICLVSGYASKIFIKTFLNGRRIKVLLKSLKIYLNIPKGLKRSLSSPPPPPKKINIRVGRVTGNKTFSSFFA